MVSSPGIEILRMIEITEAVIVLRSDGIVHVHYKQDTTLDVPLQVSMRRIYNEITEGEPKPFIFSAAEGFTITKEARENPDLRKTDSPISAYAIIANNLAYKLIANFYLRVNKPVVPYKMFSTVESAVKWLNEQQ